MTGDSLTVAAIDMRPVDRLPFWPKLGGGYARAQAAPFRDMPIDASNVMLVHKGKPTRVGYTTDKSGNKVRVAKRTGEVIA